MPSPRGLVRRLGFDVIRHPQGTQLGASLRRALHETSCDLVIDVGANVGDFARSVRRLGYSGRIVAFEPDPRAGAELERAARDDPLLLVRHEALGAASERRPLRIGDESRMSSFLEPTATGRRAFRELRRTTAHEVEVVRLDDVVDELGLQDARPFLKLDTQGWELEVLRGAERTLERSVALLVELVLHPAYDGAPDYLELLAWLRERGYEPADFDRVWQDDDGLLAEMDCLLRRARPPVGS